MAGLGYIGARLVEELHGAGEEVIGLENFFATDRSAVARLCSAGGPRLVEGSIADPQAVERALTAAGPVRTVYLLAAQSSAHPQAASVEYTEAANLIGPRVVLEAAVRHGVSTVVYGSSLRVYGETVDGPLTEHSPYGVLRDMAHLAKVYVEKLLEMYAHQHGLRCRALRLGVVHGVSPVMKRDYRFMTAPNKFCLQAARGESLAVYGGGESPQGFVHVADAVRALRSAADFPGERDYVALNAAWEVATVRQVAEMVVASAGRRGLRVQIEPAAGGSVATTGRVRSRLDEGGFVPRQTLAAGIAETLDFFLAGNEVAGATQSE